MQSTAHKSNTGVGGNEKWYYIQGGKKCGPVDGDKLVSMIDAGSLPQNTRVWTSGMDNWASAADTLLADRVGTRPEAMGTDEQPTEKKKPRWWIWLIIGLVVVGIAVGCFFLFSGGDDPGSDADQKIVYGLAESVIFENDECAFFVDAIGEKGDYLELDVRCVNKTGDVLSFVWDSVCVNGSMFDPLWNVYVQGHSTMKSSITFPLSVFDSYNLLPAEQIKFVLRVHNEDQFNQLVAESGKYIVSYTDIPDETMLGSYKQIEGYEGYLFAQTVEVDKDGRPYYISEDKTNVYFDEIYDRNGYPLYAVDSGSFGYESFYKDAFGRPYYFTDNAETVYYDGYGFAFYDLFEEKCYFYDENGKAAYYGNGGIPEYYEEEGSVSLLEEVKPESLSKADGSYIVHKEFCLYPTGKLPEEVTRPNRVTASSELVYWDGEKGSFIVLGGQLDEFKGYILHTYVENNSDSYIYFGLNDVVVNGVATDPDSITVLRPHSRAYRDILVPADLLKANKIKTVEEIDFCVYAVGENLSVPLYPIQWKAVTMTDLRK